MYINAGKKPTYYYYIFYNFFVDYLNDKDSQRIMTKTVRFRDGSTGEYFQIIRPLVLQLAS